MTGGVATIATARVRSAGNQTITASDNDGVSPSLDSHTSSAVSVKSATAAKLQTLVPGEVAVQGSPTGKTGAPYSQVVGTTFTITVNSVDAYWNKVSSTPMVNVATSDPNDTEPANNGLIDGSIVFDICFASSGTWTATANDVAAVLLSDISSEIKVNSLPPAQITTLEAYQNSTADTIKLLWITPGSDGMNNTLAEGSEYSIQYSTLDPAGVVWSTGSAQVVISTNSVAPGLKVSVTAQLAMNEIYYFRIWTKDEEGNWSVQSTTAAAFNSPYTFETVDSEGQVGFYTSIAVDGSGNPHISYSYWGTDYDLKYAKWTGSSWDIQTVDSAGLVNVGAFTSIALDTNNYPHISYLDSTDFNLKYAKWTGSSWDIQTVDSSVAVDNNSSLTLDGSGNPHVSYYDKTNGDLKYAKWTGTSWDIQTVDSTNNVGGFSSLAIDGSGNPHISYRDYTNLDLKYAKWTGSSWDIRIVDSEDDVGSWTSIAIDSLENPHISYNDYTNFDLKYAKWAGTSWSTWTVDSEGKVGWYATSIALDGSGNPHISYRSYPECALRYARWTGSSWSAQIVDSEGDLGRYSSLCLDDSGNVHISYFVFTSSDLKYAKWDGAGFEPLPKTPSNFGPSSVYISSITWSWTDNASNELGFRMYSSSPGTSGFVLVADTNTIGTVGGTGGTGNWTQKNLTPNTSYHNYVAAVNEGGVVTSSSAIKFTLANPPAETQVIAVSSESVSIQWNANSNPSDTRWGILRSTNNFATSTATLTDFGSNYTSTSFTDSGLQPDASYYYKVCAYNKDGIASDFILAMTTLTALSVPSTPKGLYGIAVASVSIKWEWDISSGSTYYRVYDDASALLVNLESPGTPTWIEVNLLHNSQHSRYVRAGNEAGLSSASNTASKYTLTIPPAGLSISSAGAHTVELSWQTNNSTRFRIDTSTAGDWTALKTLDWSASITTPPYTITELQPSTTYCFAVFGYNGDQIQTLTSATVSGVTSDLSQTLVVISPGEDKTATRTNTVGGVTLEIKVELLAGAVTKQAYLEISVDPLNSPLLVNKNKIIEANNKLALSPDAKKNVVDDTLTEFVLRDYDTGNQNTANFNNTVTLTLSYPDADNDGFIDGTDPKIPEDALKIHILNEVTNEWELAGDGGMVDKSNNNVRVEVQHFSVYALISIKTAATDLTAVKAYPNPYKPGATGADARFDRASGIRFDNLTNKVNIRVFNIAGELVFEKDAENTVGYLDWQAVNNNNEKIASGVYIYYITNPDDTSHKAKGRVAIIR
ncbi:MAG: fibronectin type III domain-containing protein [Elusimicrobiota bacterium]